MDHLVNLDDLLASAFADPLLHSRLRGPDADRLESALERWSTLAMARITAEAAPEPPRLSVVVPARNAARTIHRPLTSLAQQQDCDVEVILVDDHSDDGTGEVASRIAATLGLTMHLVRLQRHSGQVIARREGVGLAAAPYVGFLDADDWWHPYFGALMSHVARSGERVPVCSQRLIRPSGDHAIRLPHTLSSLLENRNSVSMSTWICPTSYARSHLFQKDSLRQYEDWHIAAQILRDLGLTIVPGILSNYVIDRASSVSNRDEASVSSSSKAIVHAHVKEELGSLSGSRSISDDRMSRDLIAGPDVRTLTESAVAILCPQDAAALRTCIDSILGSPSFSDGAIHEIVIVDDGSVTDDTGHLLGRLETLDRVRVVRLPQAVGFTAAANVADRVCDARRGLVLVDADIRPEPGWYEVLRNAIGGRIAVAVPSQIMGGGDPTALAHVPTADPSFASDVSVSVQGGSVPGSDDPYLLLRSAPLFCALLAPEARAVAFPLVGATRQDAGRLLSDVVRVWGRYGIAHVPAARVHVGRAASGPDRTRSEGRPVRRPSTVRESSLVPARYSGSFVWRREGGR